MLSQKELIQLELAIKSMKHYSMDGDRVVSVHNVVNLLKAFTENVEIASITFSDDEEAGECQA